jgi:hypothetical protein
MTTAPPSSSSREQYLIEYLVDDDTGATVRNDVQPLTVDRWSEAFYEVSLRKGAECVFRYEAISEFEVVTRYGDAQPGYHVYRLLETAGAGVRRDRVRIKRLGIAAAPAAPAAAAAAPRAPSSNLGRLMTERETKNILGWV